jgi:hypothetical protein
VKRSAHVARAGLAVALAASLSSCADEPDEYQDQNSAYGQVCMKWNRATGEYDVRVPDDECDRDGGHSHFNWLYIHHGGGYTAPAMGSKAKPGSYVTALPAGTTVSRPPATGGFGTFRAPIGG